MRVEISSGDLTLDLWTNFLKLSSRLPGEWTIVGAQMVALHGLERGHFPPRSSDDVDLVANVRAIGTSTEDLARTLEAEGLRLEGPNAEGIGHRFSNDVLSVDVLAPDGLSPDKPPITISPARTVLVPGGTQALRRSEIVEVVAGSVRGEVRRPSLTGAILLKARAVDVDDVPRAQLDDLAFLLSLLEDPEAVREEMSASELGWLRRRKELLDRDARPWRALDRPKAAAGHAALRIILDL
jgi:hypothetical protein